MYFFKLEFMGTEKHANADTMGSLTLPNTPQKTILPPETVLLLVHLDKKPVKVFQIKNWIRMDPILYEVFTCVTRGLQDQSKDSWEPYKNRTNCSRWLLTMWYQWLHIKRWGKECQMNYIWYSCGRTSHEKPGSNTDEVAKRVWEIDEMVKQCKICHKC